MGAFEDLLDKLDQRLGRVEADIVDLKSDTKLLKWKVGFNLAITTDALARLLVG